MPKSSGNSKSRGNIAIKAFKGKKEKIKINSLNANLKCLENQKQRGPDKRREKNHKNKTHCASAAADQNPCPPIPILPLVSSAGVILCKPTHPNFAEPPFGQGREARAGFKFGPRVRGTSPTGTHSTSVTAGQKLHLPLPHPAAGKVGQKLHPRKHTHPKFEKPAFGQNWEARADFKL